ncbi:hypothetical protein I6A84_33830 [Frankia sp. CNm7]|uniref:DUF732 domain-containing protein n=1 Tax=Frankia nepalensis TaxID=1836974 RepID=A0A937UQE3_9ACTN|nr:hypothetical protein [Frankia nepalensis]MBL7498316.1 hypothetical protein [Frankia nepalensis]MBL7512985.1 hypothetical protein [Frankia nepalensis]MBL7522935.1 hypothetical protein [Frankia nepalensis]MBL7630137.1 hypothetical protein [Frankia nepalensis]
MRVRILVVIALAATLAACGGESSPDDEPTTSTTTTEVRSKPSPTRPPAAVVTAQFRQFATMDNAILDAIGVQVCRAARGNNLKGTISTNQVGLRMTQTEAVDFTYLVAKTYCPEVELPPIGPLLSTAPTSPASPTASATPPAPAMTITPGTWLVGTHVQPGTYETTTDSTDILDACYWARLSGTSGELGDVLANGNVQGRGIVTIKPTDTAFETRCTWTKLG